jgi:hypothetical protein
MMWLRCPISLGNRASRIQESFSPHSALSTVTVCSSYHSRFNPVRYDGTVSDVAQHREAVRKFQLTDIW